MIALKSMISLSAEVRRSLGRLKVKFEKNYCRYQTQPQCLDPAQRLDRQSADSLLRLRADTEIQGRIEELAEKCIEGEAPSEPGFHAWPRPTTSTPQILGPII
jgi:hypothetical protein